MPRVRHPVGGYKTGDAIFCDCGSDDIIALSPGQEAWSRQELPAGALSDKVVLLPRADRRRRAREPRGLCVVCFCRRFGRCSS